MAMHVARILHIAGKTREAKKAHLEQESNAAPASASARPDEIASPVVPSTAPPRCVSSELRELVFERANHRREFVTRNARVVRRTHRSTDRSHRATRDAWLVATFGIKQVLLSWAMGNPFTLLG
ncbi:MAG: hypothetical protein H6834_06460 [Planctomycetes bacterium]|nr:hypothetical protein [Planctomycetota bacterium]